MGPLRGTTIDLNKSEYESEILSTKFGWNQSSGVRWRRSPSNKQLMDDGQMMHGQTTAAPFSQVS